ncbi:MAG: ATP-binding cassette domain-containing protein [Chitinophagales bacterium]|nr:ATP-binding cassette domain-containing protein [Chitinophagales bacterium]
MISTTPLSFSYNQKKIISYPKIECNRSEKLLIYGRSGSGKSTLLQMLAGLLRPDSGEIYIDGVDIVKLRFAKRDKYRGQKIGYTPQKFHLIPSLNVKDNILTACYFANQKNSAKNLDGIAEALEIGHLLNRLPKSLSLGEQQRVCIARAAINRPAVLLTDEPTSNLDDINTENVMRLLERACEIDNSALIVVTHDKRIREKFDRRIEL